MELFGCDPLCLVSYCLPRIMSLSGIEIFLPDDLAHRLHIDLALYPGDQVEIGKGAGLESIPLKMPDLFQELFELSF